MLAQRVSAAKAPCAKAQLRAAPKPTVARAQPARQQQQQKLALAGLAALSVVCATQPAEAANVISSVASASEGWPFVPPAWAPSVLVPITGLVLPAVGMAWAFTWIQKEKPE